MDLPKDFVSMMAYTVMEQAQRHIDTPEQRNRFYASAREVIADALDRPGAPEPSAAELAARIATRHRWKDAAQDSEIRRTLRDHLSRFIGAAGGLDGIKLVVEQEGKARKIARRDPPNLQDFQIRSEKPERQHGRGTRCTNRPRKKKRRR